MFPTFHRALAEHSKTLKLKPCDTLLWAPTLSQTSLRVFFFAPKHRVFPLPKKHGAQETVQPIETQHQIMGSPVSLAPLKFILWHSWWIFCSSPLQQNGGQVVSPNQRTGLHWVAQLHCSLVTRHHCLSWSIDGLKIQTINQPDILQLVSNGNLNVFF